MGGGAQLWPPPPCGVLFPALLLLMLVVGFGHRSRSSAARNAEGVAVRRFPLPQRQDVGRCAVRLPRAFDGVLRPLFPFDLCDSSGNRFRAPIGRNVRVVFVVLFFLAGRLDSAAKKLPPLPFFSSSGYLYSSCSRFLMRAWVPLCG